MTEKQWPATIDEAVGVVIATLTEEDKARIASLPESELILMHFALGSWIRNNLGLWEDNEALLQSVHERHPGRCVSPDDISMLIIENVRERLIVIIPKVH